MGETYIGDAITAVRRDTRNLDTYSATNQTGISDEDFIRYYNFAQERLYNIIAATKAKVFLGKKETTGLTASDSFYSIADNVYLGSSIVDVKFSVSGLDKDLRELRERDISYQDLSQTQSYATFYVRQNGQVGLNPLVSNAVAKLVIRYRRMVDRVDVRRGQVTARTLSSTQLTALTLNTGTDDATALGSAQYLCVCDKYGNVEMYNIPITSYNSGTGVVTLPAFTFASGETVTVGSYVTIGRWTRTHTQFPRELERYLEIYMAEKILGRDSSNDIEMMTKERMKFEEDISKAYSLSEMDDQSEIQIDDPELMINDCY